ncbi:uncharacterized protein METZ01_LOCUS433067, partial [marine metagenome]
VVRPGDGGRRVESRHGASVDRPRGCRGHSLGPGSGSRRDRGGDV